MNILYSLLAAQGRNGDTELAHVTPEEKALLKSRGGAGTINPNTGLREFHLWHDHGSHIPDKLEDMSDPDWWTGDTDRMIDNWTNPDWWVGENSWYQENLVGDMFESEEMKKRRWERDLRERTPEDVPFYMGMDEYVEDVRTGDFTTDDFMDLTDDEKFYMAQGMFKGETDFGSY